jgi:hypothetical protein
MDVPLTTLQREAQRLVQAGLLRDRTVPAAVALADVRRACGRGIGIAGEAAGAGSDDEER